MDLAPAARAIVGDDLPEHLAERACVDLLVLADRDHAGGRVVMAGGDDALGIGNDRAVVEEDVDVVLRRQQRADVALQHEVRSVGELDGLDDIDLAVILTGKTFDNGLLCSSVYSVVVDEAIAAEAKAQFLAQGDEPRVGLKVGAEVGQVHVVVALLQQEVEQRREHARLVAA